MSAHPIHSISVVGSGNVAEAIALAVAESEELHLKQIVARNPERGCALAEMTGAEWCQDAGAAAEADLYLSADFKYHDFVDADKMILVDAGHFETEIFAIDILFDILSKKISTFAPQKSKECTNPVHYMV